MKAEPRSMTLTDVMLLGAGVALGIALVRQLNVQDALYFAYFTEVVYRAKIACILGLVPMALVAAGRPVTYDRLLRPAEWALVAFALAIASDGNFRETVVLFGLEISYEPWFAPAHWLFAGVACCLALLGLVILHRTRRVLPPRWKTISLVGLLLLALYGPVEQFKFYGSDLLAPANGFGPGVVAILHRQACLWIAYLPLGLILGVPLVATLGDWQRRSTWHWAEWTGLAVLSIFLAFCLIDAFLSAEIKQVSLAWLAERGLIIGWVASVAGADLIIVRRYGPAWDRWISA